MTLNTILNKLKKYWYIVIIGLIIGSTISYLGINNQNNYRASISVGASYNNPEYIRTQPNQNALSLSKLSEFFANRFKSQEIQFQVLSKINYDTGKITKKTFYDISSNENGFINITADFDSQLEAELFLKSIKEVYNNIINVELNQNQIQAFEVKPMTNFNEAVILIKTPIQVQILPIIVCLVLSLLLVLFI